MDAVYHRKAICPETNCNFVSTLHDDFLATSKSAFTSLLSVDWAAGLTVDLDNVVRNSDVDALSTGVIN